MNQTEFLFAHTIDSYNFATLETFLTPALQIYNLLSTLYIKLCARQTTCLISLDMFKGSVDAMHKLLDENSKPDLESDELDILDLKDSMLFR